ncbi:hypothetical protein EV14_0870 [Prochlorococcus sp. MIT 0703]|nr:hypothetical protein EV12_2497 [Prochlorococcus sp. MIT 0701]KGG35299.1 hypothetical protein EV14_0870 [Prochlorococcus sp. MIT 0703]
MLIKLSIHDCQKGKMSGYRSDVVDGEFPINTKVLAFIGVCQ